jgi:hypothetical protein
MTKIDKSDSKVPRKGKSKSPKRYIHESSRPMTSPGKQPASADPDFTSTKDGI